jgi:hypothetical protein
MRSGSCPRQQMPQPDRPRPMWRAIYTPLPIVLALTLLPAIAFASPPDPSWIAGIYDGADGDDIVSLVYDTSVATAAVLPHTAPLPCLQAMTLDGIASMIPGSRFTGGPRSPPVLCSPEFAYVFDSLPPPASGAQAPVTLPSITTFRLSKCSDLQTLRVPIELLSEAKEHLRDCNDGPSRHALAILGSAGGD